MKLRKIIFPDREFPQFKTEKTKGAKEPKSAEPKTEEGVSDK